LINRLAGLGLTFYLFLHLMVLGKLANGPESYDGFVKLAHHPVVVAGEVLVVLAVLLHGFNGIRILLTSFGIGVARQRLWLVLAGVLALGIGLFFILRMAGVLS
jgi:succinate dehydrogenase / fumarate reductase cytochrome b subunit